MTDDLGQPEDVAGDEQEPSAVDLEILDVLEDTVDMVIDLRAQVAALRATDGATPELAARVDELHDAFTGVVEGLERHAERARESGSDSGTQSWGEIPAAEVQAAWVALYTWVRDVLIVRYRLSVEELRPCWYRHPAAVEELHWLHRAWLAAYRGPEESSLAAAEWHDRWLPGVLDRLRRHVRCRDVHDPIRDGGDRPVVDDVRDLERHVAAEVSRRSSDRSVGSEGAGRQR